MDENVQDSFINELPLTLSESVRAWRKLSRLSIEEVAAQASIKRDIILAFEEGNYTIFSARVYAMGYLKRMIDHFSILQGDAMLAALKTEWEEKHSNLDVATYALPNSKQQKWYITPRRLFSLIGITALAFFAWLFTSQVIGFTGDPRLRINEPQQNIVIETPIIRVRGSMEKESQLTVNGREITMNENGNFDQEIELTVGVNILRFVAQNRFGKISQETRYVVVK